MSTVDGVSLLEGLLLSSKALKQEDNPVISGVCSMLRIEQDHGFINDYFKQQVNLEATAVYLTSKYGALVDRWNRLIDRHKADRCMELGGRNDDGLRWTKEAKEQWLLNTDAKYVVFMDQQQEAERLLCTIRDLATIIFSRDKKLEQLSINYRRESEIDRRSS